MKAPSIVADRPDSNTGGGQPAQIDMFTGAPFTETPKRGRDDGRHIRLRDQTAKPAGMAHFPGTGPVRMYCQDCAHFGNVPVWRNGRIKPDAGSKEAAPKGYARTSCVMAARLFGGIPQNGGISANRSCKSFEPKTSDGNARPDQRDSTEGNSSKGAM